MSVANVDCSCRVADGGWRMDGVGYLFIFQRARCLNIVWSTLLWQTATSSGSQQLIIVWALENEDITEICAFV